MKFLKTGLLAALLAVLINQTAQADTLHLRNGDRISGTTVSTANRDTLHFRTAFGQDIHVPWAQVRVLEDAYKAPVPQPFPVEIVQAQPVPIAAAQEKPPETKTASETQWSGRVNFGASLQTGNSEKDSINTDAKIEAKWNDAHRSILTAEYNREKDDGDITEDNKNLEAMHDYFFTDQWFLNGVLGFEQDDIAELDLRTTVGGGLGYQAFEQEDLNLKFILGPSYIHEEFENGSNENSLAARWVTDYDQKFFEDLIQLFHEHEWLVPSDETKAFLFDSKSGLRVPLKKGLVASAEVDFDWDNRPEPGITEDDTKYSLKLGYEW